MRLVGWRGNPRGGDFDLDTVVEPPEVHLARRDTIMIEIKAHLAGINDSDLQLFDVVVGQTRRIGKDAHGTPCCGRKTFVMIERETQVERVLRHGC